jgi:hypothetical protein
MRLVTGPRNEWRIGCGTEWLNARRSQRKASTAPSSTLSTAARRRARRHTLNHSCTRSGPTNPCWVIVGIAADAGNLSRYSLKVIAPYRGFCRPSLPGITLSAWLHRTRTIARWNFIVFMAPDTLHKSRTNLAATTFFDHFSGLFGAPCPLNSVRVFADYEHSSVNLQSCVNSLPRW